MKILVNRKPYYGPYGGGIKFVNNFCSYFSKLGNYVIHDLESCIDIILLIDPRYDELQISIDEILHYKSIYKDTKIIHRVNENDARKSTSGLDELLRECSKISDVSCFIGKWIYDYHIEKGWYCNNNHIIHSGCNKDVFKPNMKYSELDGKIHIVSHHWSDNYLKHQGLNQWLDDFVGREKDFTFTYIGRTDVEFKNSKHIPPLSGVFLGEELGKYDLCINGTYQDPCPNSCLEILSCEIPLYAHKDGGGAVELAGLDHVYNDFNHLEQILLSKKFEKNAFVPYSWDECMKKYENIINDLCQ